MQKRRVPMGFTVCVGDWGKVTVETLGRAWFLRIFSQCLVPVFATGFRTFRQAFAW